MKRLLIPVFVLFPFIVFAQSSMNELKPADYFDFWIGEWDLTWKQDDGTMGEGVNVIHRALDGKVIQENFEAKSGKMAGFTGKSWSVYNPRTGEWKQTWVDNQGSYMVFDGEINGNRRIFKRTVKDSEGNSVIQRMVFHDIEKNSLVWDWEYSNDGGETWDLRWRIFYERSE